MNGGGLDIASATVTLGQSTIFANTATSGGGVYNTGTFILSSSTISGNTASGNGGGIYSDSTVAGTDLKVIDSTVANNVATGAGGGIYSGDVGAVLVNSTIALNRAGGGGGGLFEATSNATLTNTIVALNTMAGAPSDISGNVVGTSSNNLIGTGGSGGLVNGLPNNNLVNVANPGLDPSGLRNNGGPTQTIALVAGSVAIDAGTDSVLSSPYNLITDQRGYARKTGACRYRRLRIQLLPGRPRHRGHAGGSGRLGVEWQFLDTPQRGAADGELQPGRPGLQCQ